jgi:hypothetical protein
MYKKIEASEVPKRRRLATSRFELSPEWKLMKADFDKGLKPGSVMMVTLNEDDKAKLGIRNRRTIARFVQKYLAAHKLPYRVKSYRSDAGDVIVVERPSKSG